MRSLEKPSPGSEVAHEHPLAVNGENSRAKVQNVRGDSSAELQEIFRWFPIATRFPDPIASPPPGPFRK